MSSHGEGPGIITPDGCSVEVYSLLEPGADPRMIQSAVAPGSTVLELGAGAGRVTTPLAAAGYRMTAVDESPAMLARIATPEVVRVAAAIEGLALGTTFDAVLLMSYLVNTPDERQRREFLLSCARHLAPGGVLLGQRHPPEWFAQAGDVDGTLGAVSVRLRGVSRPSLATLMATVHYEHEGRRWAQTFTARCLDDEALESELAVVGLRLEGWLDAVGSWFAARRTVPAMQTPARV